MINKIWSAFILTGLAFSIVTNKTELITKEILTSCETAFNMVLKIFPVMALWLGIMNIALKSGLLSLISQKSYPILKKVFPEIPSNHESLGYITSNIIVNMFGLGNAATPFGLKAMKSLQQLNKKKDTASRSMITFLVINTSGVTLIPTTVISMRMMYKSINPTKIILPCIIITFSSLICGLVLNKLIGKKNE